MKIAPYGTWESPIDAARLSTGLLLGDPVINGRHVYWTEGRPQETGRAALMRCRLDGGVPEEVAPGLNVRTRVHEYGGAPYLITTEGEVIASNFSDNRLYRVRPGAPPAPLTEDNVRLRYAQGVLDEGRRRTIWVREDHTGSDIKAVNALVAISADGAQEVLVDGADFYADCRVSPDGSAIAWVSWNHPNMPWDGTELWLAGLDAKGKVANARLVAGGPGESVLQPEFGAGGDLLYISDRTGWWNIYRLTAGGETVAVQQADMDFGQPMWQLGTTTYAASREGVVATYCDGRSWRIAQIEKDGAAMRDLNVPETAIFNLSGDGERACYVGGGPYHFNSVVVLDLRSGSRHIMRSAFEEKPDDADISPAESISFPARAGGEAHALYYAPRNQHHQAPADERPPLLVFIHGGPTSEATGALRPSVQYWTTRGFAVVDVNYGGSTGYGRAYRERLRGQWGIVDVDDSISAAQSLVARGLVDERRIAIRGGRAGGYTTLRALTTTDFFAAGTSLFGLAELISFAEETHKFESRYLDGLIGPYPARRDLYVERSPLTHIESLSTPVLLLQGLDDRVVPPSQSRQMAEGLRRRHVPFALIEYEGEGHGFRQAQNIVNAQESELSFYGRVFEFTPAGNPPPLVMENEENLAVSPV